MRRRSKPVQKEQLTVSVDDCRVRLQTGKPIVFLDARRREDCCASMVRIIGALRLKTKWGAPRVPCPKHNYIVVYCA